MLVDDMIAKGNAKKNQDGSYNIFGSIDISSINFKELSIRFKWVANDFDCCFNEELISLKGFP